MDQELQATAFVIRSTINSSTKHTPGQLVFQIDMLFQSKVKMDWEILKTKRRRLAVYNNTRENKPRIEYEYKIVDHNLITLHKREIKSKLQQPTEGPDHM